MFNQELHRRLDGEEERELRVPILKSFYERLHAVIEQQGWQEADGLRQLLEFGMQRVADLSAEEKTQDEMSAEERVRFLQDRWSRVEAAYSMMKFQAYQVMNQNDALEMNMNGILPQLEAARERIQDLEKEALRLRALVPEDQRRGEVLILEESAPTPQARSMVDKARRLFGRRG